MRVNLDVIIEKGLDLTEEDFEDLGIDPKDIDWNSMSSIPLEIWQMVDETIGSVVDWNAHIYG